MTKKQQVHDLLNTLRDRTHVVEFAKKCAKRAESYASGTYAPKPAGTYAPKPAADYAADYAADAADYAAETPVAAYAVAAYAVAAYAVATAAAAAAADATERDLQITHLKELRAREESQDL